jgi:hypothetical protein
MMLLLFAYNHSHKNSLGTETAGSAAEAGGEID